MPHTKHPLHNAVIRQLGGGKDAIESAKDAARYGADGGFSGFIYYTDTCKFFKRNRGAIIESVTQMANDLGEDTAKMIAGFRCLKDVDIGAVYTALSGGKHEEKYLVENALAWYALEEVGRALEDE